MPKKAGMEKYLMNSEKTRRQKKAELRKLREENDRLQKINNELMDECNKAKDKLKEMIVLQNHQEIKNVGRGIFYYFYEVAISALILAFLYWIVIWEFEQFIYNYLFAICLSLLVAIKGLLENKEARFGKLVKVILVDLIKPLIAMYGGLFICIACLGKEWREAIDYALDVSNMSILVMFVVIVVIGIFVISYIVIFSKTVFKRIIACYNRKKRKA